MKKKKKEKETVRFQERAGPKSVGMSTDCMSAPFTKPNAGQSTLTGSFVLLYHYDHGWWSFRHVPINFRSAFGPEYGVATIEAKYSDKSEIRRDKRLLVSRKKANIAHFTTKSSIATGQAYKNDRSTWKIW